MGERIEQSVFWDQRAGAWAEHVDALEVFAGQFSDPAIDLLELKPGQEVADIGCGPGATTIALGGRVAPGGSATGVDVSPRMVEAATSRAASAGVDGVRFVVGDPGAGPIGSFDALFSRFGVMFFDDPPTAFSNLAASLRPGGRFVAVAWAALDANPWMFLPNMFAAGPLQAELTPPGPGEPGPFSLADADATTALLESSGFRDVDVRRRDAAWATDDTSVRDELGRVLAVGPMGEDWAAASDDAREEAVSAVVGGLAEYRDGDGYRVPAAALIISASAPA